MPASIEPISDSGFPSSTTVTVEMGQDEPALVAEDLRPGERRELRQDLRVEDSALDSPFLLCLSRRPSTRDAWQRVQAALPSRYDTWTITADVPGLEFEVECVIRRWLAPTRSANTPSSGIEAE